MRRMAVSIVLLCGLGRGVWAQDDAARARAAFQRGVTAYNAGKYADALEAFNEAHRTKPNPVVLYNIAQAEAELGKVASATAHFEHYLREAKNIPPERRSEVKKELARIKKLQGQLSIECNVAGAKVVLDGGLVGLTPLGRPVPVDPGAHRLVMSREGYDDYAVDLNLPTGETYRVNAKLALAKPRGPIADTEEPRRPTPAPGAAAPPPVAAAAPPPPRSEPAPVAPPPPPARTEPPPRSERPTPVSTPVPRATPPPRPVAVATPPPTRATQSRNTPTLERRSERGWSRVWFWTGVGTTAALTTGAIITGSVALSRSNEYNDPKTTPARRQEILNSGPTLAHTTDALIGLSVVAAATTVWLYFKTDWSVAPTPYGVAVAGRF